METYTGHVRTPQDAIILFEACRLGLLPRVQRRLSEKERQNIKSGSVFVWDEREAGMRRWTDGKSWSASRVSGSFLTYREMEGKRGGNGFAAPLAATRAGKTPDSTRGSDSDLEMAGDDGHDGYRYKPDGLMKQSFSITNSSGNHLHLISYYARSHPNAGGLCNPSTDPQLRHIRPQKGMYPEATILEHGIPAVTRAPMVSAPYSTVPHMAGYARSGAPQHHMYAQPGYGWTPQSPMHNGNTNGYHQYDYQYGPHGPPPPNGYSPLSHSQSANPTSQPQQTHSPHPHPHPYDRSPGPQYERSPGPNENLPPPPQRQPYHHRVSSNGGPHQQYHGHPSERMQHSGPVHQQAHHPYEQHPQQQQPPPHYPNYPPYPHQDQPPYQQSHQQYPQPPQQYANSQGPSQNHIPTRPHPQTQSSSTPIDPRLMAPSPLAHQHPSRSAPSRTPSPHVSQSQHAPHNSTPHNHTNGTSQSQPQTQSQASTIPSIGSLMNGPPPPSSASKPVSHPTNQNPAQATSERGTNRNGSGSKSPTEGNSKEAKRDNGLRTGPVAGAGPNEDTRQLQKLDRVFRT